MWKRDIRLVFWGWLIAAYMQSMCCGAAPAAGSERCVARDILQTKSVTDMTGRQVVVPRKIARIATVGSVPVINSYLFALGEGKKIVSGLPYFARSKKWRIQTTIAPHLAGQPVLQGRNYEVNVEVLLRLRPDVVITMDTLVVRALENRGIPVIVLEWRNASDIKANMKLLSYVLDCGPRGDRYVRYLDAIMHRVRCTLKGIPEASKPRVLFLDPGTLTTPLSIADWWIKEAGGISVTAGISRTDHASIGYSHEQVLLWNPDILVVSAPERIDKVYQDTRFSNVNAVLNKKVYAIPVGAHSWGHRTAEQPLAVIWAAKIFHPERFGDIDLVAETQKFYKEFFNYTLTHKEAIEIIKGRRGS